MPDPTIADEHVEVEETTAEEAEGALDAAFDEDDIEETTIVDEELGGKDETVVEQTEEEIKAEADQKVIDDAQAIEDAKTPEEIQADADQKVIDDAKIDVKAKKVEPAPELTEAEKAEAQKQADTLKIQNRDSFLSDMAEALKDTVIGDGGEYGDTMPKSMAEFAEQFPEISNNSNQAMAFLYDKIMSELNPLRESIADNQAKASNDALISELSSEDFGHADATKVIESAEFQDWVANQTPAYQNYVDGASTAQDVSAVLSRYKTEAGIESEPAKAAAESKEKAEKIAKTQRDAKKVKDNLGKASTRNTKVVAKTADGETEDDLDKAFDEDE